MDEFDLRTQSSPPNFWDFSAAFYIAHKQETGIRSKRLGFDSGTPKWDAGILAMRSNACLHPNMFKTQEVIYYLLKVSFLLTHISWEPHLSSTWSSSSYFSYLCCVFWNDAFASSVSWCCTFGLFSKMCLQILLKWIIGTQSWDFFLLASLGILGSKVNK